MSKNTKKKNDYREFILEKIKKNEKKYTYKTLVRAAKEKFGKEYRYKNFYETLEGLIKKGIIAKTKKRHLQVHSA